MGSFAPTARPVSPDGLKNPFSICRFCLHALQNGRITASPEGISPKVQTVKVMNAAESVLYWDALADGKAMFAQAIAHLDDSMSREAVRESIEARGVANALRLEVLTGRPHCSCKNPPHPVA